MSQKISFTAACGLLLSLFTTLPGQTVRPDFPARPGGQQENRPQDKKLLQDDDIVRINTNLVQVDATVLDDQKQPVRNLTMEDFAVLENGKPQTLTNFSLVEVGTPATATVAPPNTAAKNIPAPPVRLTASQVNRTIAVVIDDLCMSQASLVATKDSLRQFLAKEVQTGDLIAFFRTRASGQTVGGMFTADKRTLERQIAQLRWYPESLEFCGDPGPARNEGEPRIAQDTRFRREERTRDNLTVSKLSMVRYIIAGLDRLPGRKSVLLVSDGLAATSDTFFALRRTVESANRASVVLNTISALGLQGGGFDAQDDVAIDDIAGLRDQRSALELSRGGSLNYLAEATGGLAVRNRNLFGDIIREALDTQKSYYLLGYRPSDESLKIAGTVRNITVRVKRPGLKVRYRHGYVGIKPATPARARTADTPLVEALTTPLDTNGLSVRLATFFGYDPAKGYFVRSVIHIDSANLGATQETGGNKKLSLDVAAVALGEGGQIADIFLRQHNLRVADPNFNPPVTLPHGLVYTADIPIKKPGGYQLRVAVRDNSSQLIGSANQYIEVPDLKNNQIALSGLILSGAQADGSVALPPYVAVAEALQAVTTPSDSGVRIFAANSIVSYAYVIYNAKLKDGKPQLRTQVRIFRDDQMILETPEETFDANGQNDLARLREERLLRLNPNLRAGNYVMQVIVKDLNDKERATTQWIDFEVVR